MKKLFVCAVALGIAMIGTPSYAAKCTGGACSACKNCSGCKHCAKEGGTCSVCTGGSTPRPRASAPRSAQPSTPRPGASPSSTSRRQRQSARNVSVPTRWSGKVVGISDGDTTTVMYGSTPVRVRLNGIDAPESRQAYGTQSKQHLSRLAFGKNATVVSEGKDRYGRVLGRILVGNVDVNASMVASGYAWWYRQYARNRSDLQRHEAQARSSKRGLWRDANAVPPWEFRRRR